MTYILNIVKENIQDTGLTYQSYFQGNKRLAR